MLTNVDRVYPYIWVLPVTKTVLSWPIHEHHEITQLLHFLLYCQFILYCHQRAISKDFDPTLDARHSSYELCLKRVDSPNSCSPVQSLSVECCDYKYLYHKDFDIRLI